MIEPKGIKIIPSEVPDLDAADEQLILGEQEYAVLNNILGGKGGKYGRVAMAAMGGIPWVGSIISAAATLSAEKAQGKTNQLLFLWVHEHEVKLRELIAALQKVFARFESFGDRIDERIRSEEYLRLTREAFRVWDEAETKEKAEMLRRLITNAGGVTIVQDDIVRLFINFLARFHELHFAVIKEIYENPGISRGEIWEIIGGKQPREDSSKADLFKLLILDLSTGEVIRQKRESDPEGNWVRQRTIRHGGPASPILKSAFDREKGYVLTELGKEFVHYVMEDLAPQLEGTTSTPP